MYKYTKILALFLLLVFTLTGCANKYDIDENEVSERNFSVEESVIYTYPEPENNRIYQILNLEEDKTLLKEKEKFLQKFEEFCGFPLPDSFFIPKITDKITDDYYWVDIDDETLTVHTFFIVEKEDFLSMKNSLSNDDTWSAFINEPGMGIQFIETYDSKKRERGYRFIKVENEVGKESYNSVGMEFLYSKNEDLYIVGIIATLGGKGSLY